MKTTENNDQNVVVRLKNRLAEARKMGFKIRMELLDDEQATWCVIAGVPTLFVDLSQTAAEQLQQLDEAIGQWRAENPSAIETRSETSVQAA